MNKKTKKKKKTETSKILCVVCLAVFLTLTVFSVVAYFYAELAAIRSGAEAPSATIPLALVWADVGFYLSYCGYNGFLKNSRNKYGVDENGNPCQAQVEAWANAELKKYFKSKTGGQNK